MSRLLLALPGKVGAQALLLFRDPKRLIENIDYTLHPKKLQQKLLGFEIMPPMHFRIEDRMDTPHVNVLLPKLGTSSQTGGPNTAIVIACGLASLGIPVRLLAVDEALPTDIGHLWRHVAAVAGTGQTRPHVVLGSTIDPMHPMEISPRDVFLATYWTTAFRLKPILGRMRTTEFLYLIQDFEPSFYPWSSAYAQALQTYAMPYRALINEQFLADQLVETRTGQFADPGFVERSAVFEPAVDRRLFHPVERKGSTRTLLFYARPNQPRNLFGIGFEALCAASAHPVFAETDWRYLAIGGGSLGRMSLGDGRVLESTPWMPYEDYAALMRNSDLLLCPMLSPHTSYPVLEMAACGGIVVTNSFGSKTEKRLRDLSSHIVAEAPSVEAMTGALLKAALSAASEDIGRSDITLPGDWPSALQTTVGAARQMVQDIVLAARL